MNKHVMNTIGFVGIITLITTMFISCDSESGGGGETPPVGTSNLYAWGSDLYGQLGIGNNADSAVPAVMGTKTWTQVSAGAYHTMAIDTDNHLFAWGDNFSGQLGNGESGNGVKNTTPIAIEATKTWKLVSAGDGYTMAIDNNNHLFAWGGNGVGQLGNGNTTDKTTPVPVVIGTDTTKTWKLVSARADHTMAIDSDNHLFAWGWNISGQLGNGNTTDQTSPVQIGTKTWKLVSTGISGDSLGNPTGYTMAIDTDDHLFAWGANGFGELGITTTSDEGNEVPVGNTLTPSQVGTKTWKQVSAGLQFTVAIDTDDHLFAWGANGVGQLGNGKTTDSSTPVAIEPTKTWTQISAGKSHTMAIDTDDHLFAWGANGVGQLGNGKTTDSSTLVAIEPTKTWIQISAGFFHTMGIIIE